MGRVSRPEEQHAAGRGGLTEDVDQGLVESLEEGQEIQHQEAEHGDGDLVLGLGLHHITLEEGGELMLDNARLPQKALVYRQLL